MQRMFKRFWAVTLGRQPRRQSCVMGMSQNVGMERDLLNKSTSKLLGLLNLKKTPNTVPIDSSFRLRVKRK